MNNQPPLEPGQYYHVYNRANGDDNLFREEANYYKFLQLYNKYISPVANTLAWVLMPNHFHLLVEIKEGMYYKYSKDDFSPEPDSIRSNGSVSVGRKIRFEVVKWETINLSASDMSAEVFTQMESPDSVNPKRRKKPDPTKHFAHLFIAYSNHINNKYNRHGNLFQRPFKRKHINNENYLKQVILYIHNNPVHHDFVDHPADYQWSSYQTCISDKPTRLERETILDIFEGSKNFKALHNDKYDYMEIENWLEI